MKIAYAGYVAAYTTDGVNDKIRAQIAAWTDMGHEVELYCLSPPPTPGDDAPRVDGSVFTFTSLAERFKATRALARAIRSARDQTSSTSATTSRRPFPGPCRRFR